LIPFNRSVCAARVWSRRRWLAGVVGLFFGTWLFPINRVAAQSPVSPSHNKTLRIFVDALLPEDDLTPAASALEVHTQILKDAEQDASLRLLIADGCGWLEQSIGSLETLDSGQIERLLQAMSKADWDSGPRNFFYQIRDRAVTYYYADPGAWAGSVINRPPQPMGYPEAIIS
jgi:hypothetical protein